jgi:uncharacterized membrane protein
MTNKLYRKSVSQRGEGNAKFITTLSVVALIGYILYTILPIYYKEQQLNHDVKEETRVSAINGRDTKLVQQSIKKIVDNIDFPVDLKIEVTKKGEKVTTKCSGTIPISFIVYTYNYNVYVEQVADRGGY